MTSGPVGAAGPDAFDVMKASGPPAPCFPARVTAWPPCCLHPCRPRRLTSTGWPPRCGSAPPVEQSNSSSNNVVQVSMWRPRARRPTRAPGPSPTSWSAGCKLRTSRTRSSCGCEFGFEAGGAGKRFVGSERSAASDLARSRGRCRAIQALITSTGPSRRLRRSFRLSIH